MINAVIIDDDSILRQGVHTLINMYTSDINVVGEADGVASGINIIEKYNPQVIFLDIQMGDGTGFDILENLSKKYGTINAQIVFITAHEQYAIKAFKFSALDYLLKPIDPDELQKVIKKLKKVVDESDSYTHIDLLLDNIRKKVDGFKRIALSTSEGVHLFDIKDIIRCESNDNYTIFHIKNEKPVMVSKTLKEYEEILSEHRFERIHQSHLINLNELKSYIRKDGGYVIMNDNSQIPVSQRKKERLQELILNYK